MASHNCPSWQTPKIFLTLALVFLCGAVVGMLTMSLATHRWMHQASAAPMWREADKEISLQRFKKELDLTSSQAEQLESVLDDFFMYYHTLQAQLDDVRASGKRRILRLLNDDQKRRFEQLMSELHDKQLK